MSPLSFTSREEPAISPRAAESIADNDVNCLVRAALVIPIRAMSAGLLGRGSLDEGGEIDVRRPGVCSSRRGHAVLLGGGWRGAVPPGCSAHPCPPRALERTWGPYLHWPPPAKGCIRSLSSLLSWHLAQGMLAMVLGLGTWKVWAGVTREPLLKVLVLYK